MTKRKGNTAKIEGSPHVGSRVRFQMPMEIMEGVIVEDRGFLGVGGCRVWGVEVNEPDYHAYFELSEDDFKTAD